MCYVDIEELIRDKQIEAMNKPTRTEVLDRKLQQEADKSAAKHVRRLEKRLLKAKFDEPVGMYISNPLKHAKWSNFYDRNFNSVVAGKVAKYFKDAGMVVEEYEGIFLPGRQKIVLKFPNVRHSTPEDYGYTNRAVPDSMDEDEAMPPKQK